MTYLYLDIETLPTSDEGVIADIASAIAPPASITKAETLEQWENDKKPDLVKEAIAKTSLSGAFGSICCIGWAWGGTEVYSIIRKNDEKSFLAKAFSEMSARAPSLGAVTVVGHNVAGFDIRFIWQRCFVFGVKVPTWLPLDPKPWGREVADTMTMFSGVRDKISLDNLCKAMGLPGKGDGMTGADVASAWERGEHDEIAAYCRADVERVRAVHQRMLAAMGQ
ncbi:hypothetical protein [Labrys neptuniae]